MFLVNCTDSFKSQIIYKDNVLDCQKMTQKIADFYK